MKQKSDYDASNFFMNVGHSVSGCHFSYFDDKLSFLLLGEFGVRETDFLSDTGYSYHG